MRTDRTRKVALTVTTTALMIGALGMRAGPLQGVTVKLFRFQPSRAEVAAGERLTWTNEDDITHTITSGTPEKRDGRFHMPLDGKGATATVEFKEPGVYAYFCDRHQSMRGEIRVK